MLVIAPDYEDVGPGFPTIGVPGSHLLPRRLEKSLVLVMVVEAHTPLARASIGGHDVCGL